MKKTELPNCPKWLLDARTENENVEWNRPEQHYIAWRGGVWYGGDWRGGDWHDGDWRDGVWRGGVWRDGVWRGGVWYGGVWYGGDWYGGDWYGGVWYGGDWYGGDWRGGVWRDGVWRGGVWRDGVWHDGVWRGRKTRSYLHIISLLSGYSPSFWFFSEGEPHVSAGCFSGTMTDFKLAVREHHAHNAQALAEYEAVFALVSTRESVGV